MRHRSRRYLAVRVVSDVAPAGEKLFHDIEDSLRRLFGEHGVLKASPRLIAYDVERMIAIVRCSDSWVERLRAALALTARSDGRQLALFTTRSAGTLAALARSLSVRDCSKT